MTTTASFGTWAGTCGATTLEESLIVGFKTGEGSIEHFPAGHDDDVVTGRDFVTPENFTRQALGAIALNSAAELARRRDAEAWSRSPVREQKHRHEPARNSSAILVNPLELTPAPHPLPRRKTRSAHSSATLKRLRPFARRRLSTIRPFLVDMRTRKP
jgi:hypothetical protein